MPRLPPSKKFLWILARDSLKIFEFFLKLNFFGSPLFHMKSRVFLKYFVRSCRRADYNCSVWMIRQLNKIFILFSFIFSSLTLTNFTISVSFYHITILNFFISTYYVFSCSACIRFFRSDWLYYFLIVSIQCNLTNFFNKCIMFVVILTLIYYLLRILREFL